MLEVYFCLINSKNSFTSLVHRRKDKIMIKKGHESLLGGWTGVKGKCVEILFSSVWSYATLSWGWAGHFMFRIGSSSRVNTASLTNKWRKEGRNKRKVKDKSNCKGIFKMSFDVFKMSTWICERKNVNKQSWCLQDARRVDKNQKVLWKIDWLPSYD